MTHLLRFHPVKWSRSKLLVFQGELFGKFATQKIQAAEMCKHRCWSKYSNLYSLTAVSSSSSSSQIWLVSFYRCPKVKNIQIVYEIQPTGTSRRLTTQQVGYDHTKKINCGSANCSLLVEYHSLLAPDEFNVILRTTTDEFNVIPRI